MASEENIFRRLVGKPLENVSIKGTEFDPTGGILGALLAIIVSGIGAVMTATFIGIASIPTGIVIAVQKIAGGLRTFANEFVQAFFFPLEFASSCTLGGACASPELTVSSGGPLIQSAGVLGFLAAILAVGAALYGVATVVAG